MKNMKLSTIILMTALCIVVAVIIIVWNQYFTEYEKDTSILLEGRQTNSKLAKRAYDTMLVRPDDMEEVQPLQGNGPGGDRCSSLDDLIQLASNIDKNEFRKQKYQVAICMHDLQNDWSKTLLLISS